MIRMILYVLITLSVLFGMYKMFVDDEKGVAYASFIFAILAFLLTTNTEDVLSNEKQTIKFEDKESEIEDTTLKESAEIKMREDGEETNTQSTESVIQEMEFESNDTIEESNTIEVNRQYRGRLASDKDVDYYKFKIEDGGKISITFQHSKIDSRDRLWEIYLIDSKTDNEIIQFNSIVGITNGESDVARVPAGEYYVKINSYYYSDKDYIFKVNFSEESDLYEKEANDKIDLANNINTNMNMASMPNNNYQNVNNNMVNNVPNLTTNVAPVNNMSGQGMTNNYTNGGVVNPMNQVPSMGMNENAIPNSNSTMNGTNPSVSNTNPVPTPEPVVNQVNQMIPNENIQQGFINPMPTGNQNFNQVNNVAPNVNSVPEQTPVYNNQAMGNGNPNMVVNSWDEPRPINPVNINQGFGQNNISNIPTNSSSNQIPIQESIPVNTVPNNMQQPVNNVPNGNSAPGLNFVYGPSQNNNNLQ